MTGEDERETLVRADRIHTLADPPEAEAVLVRGGTVVAIGSADRLMRRAPGAEVLDLRGAVVTPGFTDSHIHLVDWALARTAADLTGAESPEAAARIVERHSRSRAEDGGGWIRGRGWNANLWGGFPDRKLLDRFVPDRPVLLQSHDMHGVWVNSRALELARVDDSTADPEGGRILRDEAGQPTGVLLERAVPLVERALPATTDDDLESAVLEAQRELHRLGITGIHSFPSLNSHRLDPMRILERLRADDRLRLRVLQHVPLEFLDDALRLGLRSGFGGNWIRIGAVKMFLDGALGSRTAWMLEPYVGSDDTGVRVLPEADFREAVRRAAIGGLSTTVHAIGDAAVSLALDVLGEPSLRAGALPHRIEHVQLCPPDRSADLGRAGIVASVQPTHLMTDWRAADRHWGRRRSARAYAFRSLAAGGAVLAFGSDAPVESVDPRLGLYAATTRRDSIGEPAEGWFPEERLGILEALRGYTLGPAHAAGAAGQQGSLAVGAWADFAAWDVDPLQTTGPDLLSLRCVATAVAGRTVWRHSEATRVA